MKKVLFIINPTAGKERMKRYLMSVLDLFTKADWDVTVHITQAALDAVLRDFAAQYLSAQ